LGWTDRLDDKFIQGPESPDGNPLFTLIIWHQKRREKGDLRQHRRRPANRPHSGQQGTVSAGGQKPVSADLVSVDEMDLWKEIHKGLRRLYLNFRREEKETSPDARKAIWTRVDDPERGHRPQIERNIWVTDYPAI